MSTATTAKTKCLINSINIGFLCICNIMNRQSTVNFFIAQKDLGKVYLCKIMGNIMFRKHEKIFKNKRKTLVCFHILCILKKVHFKKWSRRRKCLQHLTSTLHNHSDWRAIMLKTILYCVELIYQHHINKIHKEILFFDLIFGSRYGPTVIFA